MRCPHQIPGCVCEQPGARPDVHGQPAKPCAECGGETGLHKLDCRRGLLDAPRIMGFDLPPEKEGS